MDPSSPPTTTKACKCTGFKNTSLDWSHPGGKSRTGMAPSILRQLGKLLDKPVAVVPGKYVVDFKYLLLELYLNNSVHDQHLTQYIQSQS